MHNSMHGFTAATAATAAAAAATAAGAAAAAKRAAAWCNLAAFRKETDSLKNSLSVSFLETSPPAPKRRAVQNGPSKPLRP